MFGGLPILLVGAQKIAGRIREARIRRKRGQLSAPMLPQLTQLALGDNRHFNSLQLTGNATYTKRVWLGVPNVMLEPLGMKITSPASPRT